MHDQYVRIKVRYNTETRTIEIYDVLAGTASEELSSVETEPQGSLHAEERFWPVLRIGGRQLVLCEIPCES